MPDLLDRIYCSEQIHVPPTFPYIMKLYCKAAIRTQPYDLLKWSAAYFRALANGEEPPAKERVEYPPYDSPSGLTPGYLKILINQFGRDPETTITARTLFTKWNEICLQEHLLVRLIALLGATTTINWVKFVGVCAGFISKTLTQTMVLICELFTEEPEGGMATIPYTLFIDLYIFLAQMECGPLTDKEKEELEAIEDDEGVCEVAEKIKRGIYEEGEGEGEFVFAEEIEEQMMMTEEEPEEEKLISDEEEMQKKESLEFVAHEEEGESRKESSGDAGEGKTPEKQNESYDDISYPPSDDSTLKEMESAKSVIGEDEREIEGPEEEGPRGDEKPGESLPEDEKTVLEEPKVETKQEEKKINLEDMEESIRLKIEEKLAEDKESYEGEQDREFEELSSYLLGAAARVKKYTTELLGYRIFKKYLRQDVPGIGPYVETEQVEKVVDFMDFWSHKQEEMVMPRNIRHWMCPPLDKVPTPEP